MVPDDALLDDFEYHLIRIDELAEDGRQCYALHSFDPRHDGSPVIASVVILTPAEYEALLAAAPPPRAA